MSPSPTLRRGTALLMLVSVLGCTASSTGDVSGEPRQTGLAVRSPARCDVNTGAPERKRIEPGGDGMVEWKGSRRDATLKIPRNSINHAGPVDIEIRAMEGDTAGVVITATDAVTNAPLPDLQFEPAATLMMKHAGCGTKRPVVLRREQGATAWTLAGDPSYPWFTGSVHVKRTNLSAYALAVP